MTGADDEKRLNEILEMIGRIAALDFNQPLETHGKNDMIDALAIGLNMLSEELSSNVVEKSKLDSVNQKLEKFAYTTAHDLKSPLNSMTGLVQLLEITLQAPPESDVGLYLSKLRKTIEQMKSLVHGVLDYSRLDAERITREAVDLNRLVDDLFELYQFERKQVELKRINDLPVAYFNRVALTQVVKNLMDNAIKYCDKEVCSITVKSTMKGEICEIAIEDNGPGVALENKEKIFELFNAIDTSAKVGSHGIGLATVKRLLNQEGETIWVESKPGAGATFIFTLHEKNRVK